MPYSSTADLPDYVKKYPAKRRRQWMHVFNSVHGKTGSEKRAFQAANSVANKKEEDLENLLVLSVKNFKNGT